jgi:LPXTG-motif cell wall-anchored protein
VHAFRLIALAYALAALLIAPSGIGADTLEPPPTVETPATPAEPVPEPLPAEDPAAEPTTTVSEETEEAAAPEEEPATTVPERAPKKKEPVARAAASGSVTISDFEFTPKTITVNEGDTITWTNKGPTLHTATAEDGSFDTGNLDKGESGSATFTSPGTIPYICTPHPFMKGKVVVKAASAGNDDSGSDDDDAGEDDVEAGSTVEDADSDSDDDDDDGLPVTGAETALIALLGVLTLGAGILLRRRASD